VSKIDCGSANGHIMIISGMRVFVRGLVLGRGSGLSRPAIEICCLLGSIRCSGSCGCPARGICLISRGRVFLAIFIGAIFVGQLSLDTLSSKSEIGTVTFATLIKILAPFTNFILIALLSLIGSQILSYRLFRHYS
jgi:hypothetical protein